MCFISPFRKYRKALADLYERKHELENCDDGPVISGSEMDDLINKINSFVEGDYAEAVFEYYKKKEPVLIRNKTGEEIKWKEAFGESFSNISTSLRHSLVGLVEGGGRYRLKP